MDATRIRRFRCSLTICLGCRQPATRASPWGGCDIGSTTPARAPHRKGGLRRWARTAARRPGWDGPHEQHHAVQRSVRDHGPDTVEKVIHGQEVGQRALLVERPPAVRLHPALELQPFPVGLHVRQGPHLRGQHLDAHDLGLGDAVLLQLPVGVITARRDIDLVSLEQEHHLHLAGRGIAQHLDLVVGGDHLPGHRVVRGMRSGAATPWALSSSTCFMAPSRFLPVNPASRIRATGNSRSVRAPPLSTTVRFSVRKFDSPVTTTS